MLEFFRRILDKENKLGIVISVIVAVFGCISYFFIPSLQFISFILQGLGVFIITAMLSAIIKRLQHEIIESSAKATLGKIEDKYKGISCNSAHLSKILHLNDGGNYLNVAHNIFFKNIMESYYNNGEERKYYISIDTYYKVIKDFLSKGYRMKTINGMLLPFWYVPKEKNEALTQYTDFCQNHTDLCERVTYYQDYEDDSWKDNTVKMIYLDLLSSEKSDDVAVRWLVTLIAKIKELKTIFGDNIEEILGIKEEILGVKFDEYFPYLQYRNTQFAEAIKKNIKSAEKFLDKDYDRTITISRKMTDIINNKFLKDMNGKNRFVKKGDIDARFAESADNFEDITAVCYFYKENEQFVIFQNGSNTGQSVEIKIIIEEDKITEIQRILSGLFTEKQNGN